MNFIAENPQNFSQFPPVKVQFSTLDEYFTARANDLEQLEQKQTLHHSQQQNQQQHASTDAIVSQGPLFNTSTSTIPTPPLLPPGSDFLPFVPALAV